MAARRKYDSIINNLHNDWCRENGYPVRVRFTSYKLQAASIKLSNQPERAPSSKQQAPSGKLQATSRKQQAS